MLLDPKIAISMDGKGVCRDNVFVERLWRTFKYEKVYLPTNDSLPEPRGRFQIPDLLQSGSRDSSLDGRTPDEAYFDAQEMATAA
jgi:putative transposase